MEIKPRVSELVPKDDIVTFTEELQKQREKMFQPSCASALLNA